ncbi:MAG: dihydropteroate synthase-like protein [Candidatus Bathyarchaeota archaeon]|jgi:dihydropteroate synthase-like protein
MVTGKLASESIRWKVGGSEHEVKVYPLSVSVAAFITPSYAADQLRQIRGDAYDLILLPGTVRGDVTQVEEATGIPTFKGPSSVNDLPLLLELLGELELSKTQSASELLSEARQERALREISLIEENWQTILEEHGGMVIGSGSRELAVGRAFPMRVIAEIVNAPTLEPESVEKRAQYYEREGANIVDIGMLAGDPKPEVAGEMVETVKGAVDLPVSIDTLNPAEIKAAVEADVDLVLSIDRGNMEELAPYLSNIPVVVLPTNMSEGFMPKGAKERVDFLMENIERARELGINEIIADPVLEPAVKPGLLKSLEAYRLFRLEDETTPVLYGLGNVTELIDIDSPGVNGLLTALASEVGADLLFIPEHSAKAKRSVRETARAAKMMYLAQERGIPPKDLGIDLLILKEKRWEEPPYDKSVEETVKVLPAELEENIEMDRRGWFTVQVDRDARDIVATHYKDSGTPNMVIRGKSAREVYQTAIREGLLGRLDHAAYLGKELYKAETALLIGRSYTQDEPLF